MPGLTLTLRPNERFLVGGALIENGPRKSSIRITDDSVFVLRLSDALHPDDVATPVTRAYHAAQLILASEVSPEAGRGSLIDHLSALASVFARTEHEATVDRARTAAELGRFHGVLGALKPLIAVEAELLAPREKEQRLAG